MVDTTTDVLAESVPKLEQALHDFIARAMDSGTQFPLRVQFFQIVPMMVVTLRDFRKGAGMPMGLPMNLAILLGEMRAEASRLLHDPGLDDEVVLPMLTVIEQLVDQALLGLAPPSADSPTSDPLPPGVRRGRRAVRH